MIKIGFIDNFLSEWHANNYPQKIAATALAKEHDMKVAYAYAKTEVSPYDGVTTDQWCEKFGVQRANSPEEVVDNCDVIVVLSPDNPELHEELADYALRSGKPTYIDKTFAPDPAAARRMFALAEEYGTPMYSSSALRFSEELQEFRDSQAGALECVAQGPGDYETYAIHTFEVLTAVMKGGAKRLMGVMNGQNRALLVEYEDGRRGMFLQTHTHHAPFALSVKRADGSTQFFTLSNTYFDRFIGDLAGFFVDRIPRVSPRETEDMMRLLAAGKKALECPGTWIEV